MKSINAAIQFYNYLFIIQKRCIINTTEVIKSKNEEALKVFSGSDTSSIRNYLNRNFNKIEEDYQAIQKALDEIDILLQRNNCSPTEVDLMKKLTYTKRQENVFEALDKIYGQINDMILNDGASLIINRFTSINESNFTVTSETIKATQADKIQFTISIKPKTWLPCNAVEQNFIVTYKVKGGVKVDFSTGIFANFGGNDFHGNNYFISSARAITKLNTSSNSLIPSIGGLMHVYWRTGGSLNAGLALGASLTTDFKITNFHGGPTFIVNTNNDFLNRVALTFGYTLRYIKDLSRDYAAGQVVDTNITIDQLEVGKYKWGGFVALTWNLTKKEK